MKSDCFINTDGVEDGGNTSLLRREERKLTGGAWCLEFQRKRPFQEEEEYFRRATCCQEIKDANHYVLNKHPAPGNRPLVLLMGPAWSASGHLVNHPNMLFLVGTVCVLPKTMVSVHPAHCSVDNKCYFTRNSGDEWQVS